MIQCTGQTLLVTGGAGNLGSYVVEALAREGASRVVVVDNFYNGYLDNLSQAEAIEGCEIVVINTDIAEHDSLLPIFLQYRPVGVFNMASMLTLDCKKESRQAVQYNIVGTWNVVDCCLRAGVERLVHSSSASVFGEPRYLPVDETHPFDNKLLYGATKIANEALLTAAWHEFGLRWVGLRYYNVYSERQRRGHLYTQVIPKWAHEIATGGRLTINDDGSQTMDLIHAEDVARANVAAMVSDTNNELFNIGTGIETSVRQLAEWMIEFYDSSVQIVHQQHDPNRVKRRASSIEKAERMLGFTAQVEAREGIRRCVEQFKTRDMRHVVFDTV